jgi:uncharacterized membrane protein (UPF0127 family)
MAKFQKFLKTVGASFTLFIVGHVRADVPEAPQKLPVKKFFVCGKPLRLEMARQESERTMGLMHRKEVSPGTGMIFVFAFESPRQFWMKNVGFDIDIGYFDADGKLLNALTMKGSSPLVKDEALPRYESSGPAQFAVEAEKGFFSQIKDLKYCRLSPVPKPAL